MRSLWDEFYSLDSRHDNIGFAGTLNTIALKSQIFILYMVCAVVSTLSARLGLAPNSRRMVTTARLSFSAAARRGVL